MLYGAAGAGSVAALAARDVAEARACRAELELALLKTKVTVAQQVCGGCTGQQAGEGGPGWWCNNDVVCGGDWSGGLHVRIHIFYLYKYIYTTGLNIYNYKNNNHQLLSKQRNLK